MLIQTIVYTVLNGFCFNVLLPIWAVLIGITNMI